MSVNIEQAHPFAVDLQRSQPFPGRRAVLAAPSGQRSVHFGVVMPRDRTDIVEVVVEHGPEARVIRAKDVVPELRDAVVEQARTFVRRMLTEAAADLLG